MSLANTPLIRRREILEGTPLKVMARCLTEKKVAIQKASLLALRYTVFDVSSGVGQPVVKVAETTLVIDDVWFNSMQTDEGWEEDTTGYNFGAVLPAATFTKVGKSGAKYQVEIRATPVTGEPFWVGVWIVDVVALLSLAS